MRGKNPSTKLIALALLVILAVGPALQVPVTATKAPVTSKGQLELSLMPPQDPKNTLREPHYSNPAGPSSRALKSRTTGDAKILVIPIQFKDVAHNPVDTPQNLTNRSLSDQGFLNLHAFYNECSRGQLNISGEVTNWVNSSYNMSYYGADGADIDSFNGPIYRLVTEAVQKADNTTDFSQFDTNGDGVVDHLFIVHAGQAEEGMGGARNDIWSHNWAVLDANLSAPGTQPLMADGVQIYSYSMVSEYSPVGTWAHEFGHDLGLPDLYDIDGSSLGVGRWDIMGTGSWNGGGKYPSELSAWSKVKLGWVTPIDVSGPLHNISLEQVETGGPIYRLHIGDPQSSKEYFLLENRQLVGFDQKLPGKGLLIWHIDDSQTSNTDDAHRLVDLEEADEATAGDSPNDAGDPWQSSTDGFWAYSVPTSDSYSGQPSGWSVYNIGPSQEKMNLSIDIIADDVGVSYMSFDTYVQENTPVTVVAHVFNFGIKDQTSIQVVIVVSQGSGVVDSLNTSISSLKSLTDQPVTFKFTPTVQGNFLISVRTILAGDQVPENDESDEILHVTTIIFQDNVENGINGWKTSSNRPPSDIWNIIDDSSGANQVMSPHHAWFGGINNRKGGNYIPLSDYYLYRTFDMKFIKTGFLVVSHREDLSLSVQNKTLPRSDTGFVEVMTNLNTTYTVLDQYTGTSGGWSTSIYDLSPLLGKVGVLNMTVRFRLSTQYLGYNKGWWLDDILIVGQWSEHDISIRLNKTLVSAKPGGTYSLSVTFWNSGATQDTYILKVYAPAYWNASLPEYEITVDALKSKALSLTFTAYAKALAGQELKIQVEATSKADAAVSTKATLLVMVEATHGLYTSSIPQTVVLPGSYYPFLVDVSNRGNIEETVNLALEGSDSIWAYLTVLNMTIEPFETKGVEVPVTVPEHIKNGTSADIDLAASTSSGLRSTGSIVLKVGRTYGLSVLVIKDGGNVTPGGSTDLTVNLTNEGNDQDPIQLEYLAPPGWAVQGEDHVTLGAWESITLLLTVAIPQSSPLSSFMIKVRATSPAGQVTKEAALNVNVVLPDPAIVSLELSRSLLNKPGNVTITVVVQNKGTGLASEIMVSLYDGSKVVSSMMTDDLATGQSQTLTFDHRFGVGHHDISVVLSYDKPQSSTANDQAQDSLKVNNPSGFIPGFGAEAAIAVIAVAALASFFRKKQV